ncbi:AlkZ family DNA glycosylase [Candidatus Poribacteria bacterium]|nr:AlkZ family DNA glycosylase [Candidatus Poribacteria bacterium]
MVEMLTRRGLSRATLARQLLLEREAVAPLRAIERLAGMQAQEAKPPFIGLWTRLSDFRREALLKLLHSRKAVRATAMRATIHLMSAKDFRLLRGPLQPALSSAMQSALRHRGAGLDMEELLAKARAFFGSQPGTFAALREHLDHSVPDVDARALAYAIRTHLPLVQISTDAEWGFPANAEFTTAEAWLEEPVPVTGEADELVLRYLAAFGPASVADAQAWSGLRGLKEVFERLRPRLRMFRDDAGRELFDLPKAPRPSAETEAAVRFLPEYDNLILGHADRSRVIADEYRKRVVTANLRVLATFLVDGFVAGTWKIERTKTAATLVIEPFGRIGTEAREQLECEGGTLLRFAEPTAEKFGLRFSR